MAAKAATINCRGSYAPAIGVKAATAPVRPSPKVQTVSTQPELPVRCWMTQATDMIADRATEIEMSAAKN